MDNEIDRKDFMLFVIIALLTIMMLCGCQTTIARVPVVTPLGEVELELNGRVRVPWLAQAWEWATSNRVVTVEGEEAR